jgi:hypothetical protein
MKLLLLRWMIPSHFWYYILKTFLPMPFRLHILVFDVIFRSRTSYWICTVLGVQRERLQQDSTHQNLHRVFAWTEIPQQGDSNERKLRLLRSLRNKCFNVNFDSLIKTSLIFYHHCILLFLRMQWQEETSKVSCSVSVAQKWNQLDTL